MKIKKLILSQFKGVKNAEYSFDGDGAIVSGQNGSGKTTIADAWFWLFTDKDYSLKSNPEVHPMDLEESEPSVEAICDIDGKEVSFRKIQKDARTKKSREKGDPIKIKNTFEVNSVPMSQTDFEEKLHEYGIDQKQFLLQTHPEIFMGQKTADCRKVLFGMTTDVTDMSIAKESGFAETAKLLESYTADEITAMQKRSKKEAESRIDAIPNEIIGLEKAITEIDVKSLSEQASTLQAEIEIAETDVRENPLESIGTLNEKVMLIKQKMNALNEEADRGRRASYEKERSALMDLMSKHKSAQMQLESKNYELSNTLTRKHNAEARFTELKNAFVKAKAEEFDESSNVCKYCGQTLPADRADENRRRFEKAKEEKKHSINQDAKDVRKIITASEADAKNLDEEVSALKDQITGIENEITAQEDRVKIYEVPTDAKETDGYKNLVVELEEANKRIAERDAAEIEYQKKLDDIRFKRTQFNAIRDTLALQKVNENIEKQIADLREEQRDKSQAVADAEKILYQLSQINAQKNTLLEDQVNSHFGKVKFKLFEQLKNGDYRDCCVPVIDGKVLGQSTNTAREILAKLDIIQGLQEFYKVSLPVFLDGGEALDTRNSNPDVPYQLITLKVADNPELEIV